MPDDVTPRPPSDITATSGEDTAAGPPTTDRATDPDADPLTEPPALDPGSEDVATAGEGLAPLSPSEAPAKAPPAE